MAFPFFFRHGRKQNVQRESVPLLLSAPRAAPADLLRVPDAPPPSPAEYALYDALRFHVPVIDAAIHKIVRLTGGFRLTVPDPEAQAVLDRFSDTVPVNASGVSLQLFADRMLDSLLTYGNDAGEILTDDDVPAALVTVHPQILGVSADGQANPHFFLRNAENSCPLPLPHPERILFAALDPPAGAIYGVSVLRGLPAVSGILMRIFACIGQNYDRAGNIRYAVTYRPDSAGAPFAKEHAKQIADAWQEGIQAAKCGEVQDFVAVGDIDIKVIGSENQLFDTNIPVRQLLEQIVSKLSVPPFLLGLSWSTTERMSKQQADILTSELDYFRRILSPVLKKIGAAVLRGAGFALTPAIEWDIINLQDETELAEARLKNAQAEEIELRNIRTKREEADASGI